jgi:hypothetical protein
MFSLGLYFFLYGLQVDPQNINLERYDVIPPLGRVTSIASSVLYVYALSDNYLLIFERPALKLARTVFFNPAPTLVAYDQADELWLATSEGLVRYNLTLGSVREYPFSGSISALASGLDNLYFRSGRNYALEITTGKFREVAAFPDGLKWSAALAEGELRRYPYLIPYYFQDELTVTRTAETRFPITALREDGLDLFVGTGGYGLLKYNTVSGQKARVIYGPLDLNFRRVRKIGDRFYFLTGAGVSQFNPVTGDWDYRRLNMTLSDLFVSDSNWVVTSGNAISYISGTAVFPMDEFSSLILSAAASPRYFYVGTGNGMFRIERGTSEALAFGPEKQPVLAIAPVGDVTYVGTELSLFRYRASADKWARIFPRGVKKIVPLGSEIFILSLDNQLIIFRPDADDTLVGDSSWVLLPYFNIYDIESDGAVLYCAGYNGLSYYEPATGLLKTIYRLPRQKYNTILVTDQYIFAVADRLIYRLPVTSRD